MSETISAVDIRNQYEDTLGFLDSEGLEIIYADLNIDKQIYLIDYSLTDVAELGQHLGSTVFYVALGETDEGKIEWIRLYFFYQGIAHVRYIESDDFSQIHEYENDEKIEESKQKRELADELLEQYPDFLNNAEAYRLKHHVDRLSMERLFYLQDRLQQEKEEKEKEARIDEEVERKLAKVLAQNEQFNRQFNETDTEHLLQRLDVEFEDEEIRIQEVHRRAKSLLKIGE